MNFNETIKMLLEENEYGAGFSNWTDQTAKPNTKSRFDYSAVKEHSPEEISPLLKQIDSIVGSAYVSSKEDLQKYLDLTDKVIILTRNAENDSWPRFIPGPIAMQMIEKGSDEILKNIFQYSPIFRKYAEMLGVRWPETSGGKTPDTIFAFKSSKPLATETSTDNDEITNLEKWVGWLKDKRANSWIIADHELDELGVD